jgi:hypothetical protein
MIAANSTLAKAALLASDLQLPDVIGGIDCTGLDRLPAGADGRTRSHSGYRLRSSGWDNARRRLCHVAGNTENDSTNSRQSQWRRRLSCLLWQWVT